MTLDDWQQLAGKVGVDRGVLVQPSVYGFDNTVLLDALAGDPDNLRGIAVLPQGTPASELNRLDRLGVRGVRINTRNKGGLPFEAVAEFAAPLTALGWTLQFQVQPEHLPVIADLTRAVRTPIVVDHLGFIPLGMPETERHIGNLQRLLDTGRGWVKLSAPYRLVADWPAFAAVATRLLQSHPERLLWGSDWPHTELWADVPDDADLVDAAMSWLASEALRHMVFVDNPHSLFF